IPPGMGIRAAPASLVRCRSVLRRRRRRGDCADRESEVDCDAAACDAGRHAARSARRSFLGAAEDRASRADRHSHRRVGSGDRPVAAHDRDPETACAPRMEPAAVRRHENRRAAAAQAPAVARRRAADADGGARDAPLPRSTPDAPSPGGEMKGASAARLSIFAAAIALAAVARGDGFEFGPPFVIHGGFHTPAGLGIDPTGTRLFVADSGNHRFRWTAVAGIEASPSWSEAGFVAARTDPEALSEPQGIAVDSAGNAFVVDTLAGEVQLYRWNAASSTFTYDSTFTSTNRHTVAGTDILFPRDIAVGPDGKVYLLDSGNRRILVADGPADTSWDVWRSNTTWRDPYGIDVGPDGTVYVADTDNHRIVKITGGGAGTETTFGTFGTGNGQFRFPRDVAVDPSNGRMFVADTDNHRVVILRPDGTHYRNLGAAPLFGTLQKICVDTHDHVFVLDSNQNAVVAYLGPAAIPPFDAYIRDYAGDPGENLTD